MPPERRRAAIVAAAVELLESHGPDLTTRMVAEAAGVAEGTLFRVFPTLGDLLAATYAEYLSPERLRGLLDAVDVGDDLESATLGAVGALVAYFTSVHHAFHPEPPRGAMSAHQEAGQATFRDRFADLHAWLLTTFTPYADELTIDVADYSRFLKTLAIGHIMSHQSPGPADAITDFALNGARRRTAQASGDDTAHPLPSGRTSS